MTNDEDDVIIVDYPPDFEKEEPTRRLATPTETMAQVQLTPVENVAVTINSRTATLPMGSRGRIVLRLG